MPEQVEAEVLSPEQKSPVPSESEAPKIRSSAQTDTVSISPSVNFVADWTDLPPESPGQVLQRCRALRSSIFPLIGSLRRPNPKDEVCEDYHWLFDNSRLLVVELHNVSEAFRTLRKLPQVRASDGKVEPRIVAVAKAMLVSCEWRFSDECLSTFVDALQESKVLRLRELWALVPALKLVLLEKIAAEGPQVVANKKTSVGVGTCIHSLIDVTQAPWKDLLEPLIAFDRLLEQDPAGAYARMDFSSRDMYRVRLMEVAEHSNCSEMEVAAQIVKLAQEAKDDPDLDPRMTLRRSHVGYYLVAEGADLLHQRVGFRPPLFERIQAFLRQHPDEFYLSSIEVLTFVILSAILLPKLESYPSLSLILFSMLVLLLPCSQSAVQVMNYLATSVLPPRILPKLDFSEAIPLDCLTLVAVPALLLTEKQVQRLVDDLEVRYLGNHDPNLHFALLTDLPDSHERPANEEDPLVKLCSDLIEGLNEKYAAQKSGSFLLLHRHRVYNPYEGVWMGWERKRGKLMDLNKLLRHEYDSFPVKAGDLSILPQVRFVLTLDADTELPRGAAQRMIGTLAHPLNQAIIDPEKNTVIAGYGILQPRAGVSVQSASRTRLANIYSGQTGFDIYTRAVSDVYQDLYGEGSFAGKGIYEVDTVHRVLDRRFPRNSLLSHDLIEGAYARAGLVSDIEIIEDYPSHYSAYNRRKHRWLRGDWQVAEWLFSYVKNELGERVRNPISLVSQWKILDNLRRSLVEPATLLLLVMGWLVFPGPARYWTLATVAILFVPAWCQFIFNIVKAAVLRKSAIARDAAAELWASNINVLLTLTFLAHQTLVAIDAVVRVSGRRITKRRLLEWETAAEAELGAQRRTPVDIYLDWIPALALVFGALIFFTRRSAFSAAAPILVLWVLSKGISSWLNRPPRPVRSEASRKDELFLRRAALRTWRYYADFSTEEHNWLIPDNVQEEPFQIAARISPTNLGLLLNCRQVAAEFGYITIPEFVDLTEKTLGTIARLPKHRGHLYNWYDTRTLVPLNPMFVSSVDSGNLMVSVWTLSQGCRELLRRPLLNHSLAEGVLDHVRQMADVHGITRRELEVCEAKLRRENWLQGLLHSSFLRFSRTLKTKHFQQGQSALDHANERLQRVRELVADYLPWLLPEYGALMDDPVLNLRAMATDVSIADFPSHIDRLAVRLKAASSTNAENQASYEKLLPLVEAASVRAEQLARDLSAVIVAAEKFADEMDFAFLLEPRRKLLSIGYDASAQKLQSACYDLLASEARIAVFGGIAKDDIPQETWFLLGRSHTLHGGRPVLLSWTGTMFEYLMPSLWMKVYPGTLLERSRAAAVRMQQEYAAPRQIPWGISESAFARRDDAGNYGYRAFGIPQLAVHVEEEESIVISPYSTFLALSVDAAASLRNLRGMTHDGWFGTYGFYESADFPLGRRPWRRHRYELVRCWMAHHQGMSLLSIANFLHDGVIQNWFHADPRVQATELLLHEKPVAYVRPVRAGYGSAAA